MIKHTVFFKLNHPVGSEAEAEFLKAALALGGIPGVKNMTCVKQVSLKTDFTYGLLMEFDDDKAYQQYNVHPDHVTFVAGRWRPEVAAFLELDYVKHPLSATKGEPGEPPCAPACSR
jgi:hypothetical protein